MNVKSRIGRKNGKVYLNEYWEMGKETKLFLRLTNYFLILGLLFTILVVRRIVIYFNLLLFSSAAYLCYTGCLLQLLRRAIKRFYASLRMKCTWPLKYIQYGYKVILDFYSR